MTNQILKRPIRRQNSLNLRFQMPRLKMILLILDFEWKKLTIEQFFYADFNFILGFTCREKFKEDHRDSKNMVRSMEHSESKNHIVANITILEFSSHLLNF